MRARSPGSVFWWLVVVGAAIAAFVALAEDAAEQRSLAWEQPVIRSLSGVEQRGFEALMVACSFLGAGLGLLLLLTVVVVVLARGRHFAEILFVCGSLLVAQVVNRIVKDLIAKRRPPVPDHELVHALGDLRLVVLVLLAIALLAALATPRRLLALTGVAVLVASWLLYEVIAPSVLASDNFSFPSGHATSSMAFSAAVAVVAWPTRLRWPVIAGAALFVTGVGVSRVAFAVHYPSDVLGGWTLAIAAVSAVRLVMLLALPRRAPLAREVRSAQ